MYGSGVTVKRFPLGLRQQVAAVVALAAALAIPATLPFTMPDLFPTAAGSDNPCYKYTRAEKMFASKMNQARKAQGLRTMKLDPEISKVGKVHTRDMVRSNTLVHSSSTELTRRVTNWVTLGENVGVGSTVPSLHTSFMNSPAHKANILHKAFNNVGVGTIKRDGRMWVTVIFEATSNPGTRLKMPSC